MSEWKTAIEKVILNPNYHTILSIIKGFRNGAVYGAKIRFPHALVMTFLFRGGSIQEQAKIVLEATYKHSRNLAFFVTIYKSLMALQRFIRGKEASSDSFFAGLIGGYIIFGDNNNINMQIVLYLFSRILVGLAKLIYNKQTSVQAPAQTYPIFAAIVWGIVMWLFRHERNTLQPSLQASMQYLYNDSEKWNGLKNWIWHNQ
jgi:peroxisomal membrane protein 4